MPISEPTHQADHDGDVMVVITQDSYESSVVTLSDVEAITKKFREASGRPVSLRFSSCRFEDDAADALERTIHENGRSNLQNLNLLFVLLQPWRIGRLISATTNLQKVEFATQDTQGARQVFDALEQHRSSLTDLVILVPRKRGQPGEIGLPRVIAGGILNFSQLANIKLILSRLSDGGLGTLVDGLLLLKPELQSICLTVTGGLSHVSLLTLTRLLKGLSQNTRVEIDISNCRQLFVEGLSGKDFVAAIKDHPPQALQLSGVGLAPGIATQLIQAAEHMSHQRSQLHLEGSGFAHDETFFRQVVKSLPQLALEDLSIYDYDKQRIWTKDQEMVILKALHFNTALEGILLSPARSKTFSDGAAKLLRRNKDIRRLFKIMENSKDPRSSANGWISTLAHVNANIHDSSPCHLIVQHCFQSWLSHSQE